MSWMGGSTLRTNEVALGSLQVAGEDLAPEFNVKDLGQGQGSNGFPLEEGKANVACLNTLHVPVIEVHTVSIRQTKPRSENTRREIAGHKPRTRFCGRVVILRFSSEPTTPTNPQSRSMTPPNKHARTATHPPNETRERQRVENRT
ncbi:hypothetical protein BS47DRAFT_1365702 [Hydnum rufescens UP504]|uniref:Uncharacterized protein n=1 Tax=Hydnum rufescens UP504 TaxID=1448309 RepID=A0A9P6AP00_9AGAM|nr:hypothetical protein BS47DRAFT_1365702 [Hydnum rufescens UP504]